jgi:hypothetical protein
MGERVFVSLSLSLSLVGAQKKNNFNAGKKELLFVLCCALLRKKEKTN